ncbi:acyl-CoA N-acyltransferase [Aaosphaeria arxii CBS 175.79]|uniref:Acyl-CoA N-acyltransferase n=1 Tax=Aaosphaeria arxii CBS 175.79 TaxID=1450172 RepID=A0A6A5XFR3_9PLEO|nr:acyl-CoA N-acyltransferase [Aaosphaeria arxii CBS 175.79]KAF2012075.1 acyl-CoA N-acyltransferase [Aaosphaeria arxii CBS 175.79]
MVLVDPAITAKTERLLIRPLLMEDAVDINIMRSNPEVMKHTPIIASDDLDKSKAWIQGCHDRDNCWNFVMELLPSAPQWSPDGPRVIGLIGAVRAPEVGYMLNPNHWGKGYATEALRAFLPLFFDHFSGGEYIRYEYAEALTDPELVASQNVLQKAGFTLLEKREKDFENPVLGWRDTLVFRCPRPGGSVEEAPSTTVPAGVA